MTTDIAHLEYKRFNVFHRWMHFLCLSSFTVLVFTGMPLKYQSAWFMAHRIREAMKRPPMPGLLKGIVEADETYVGGKFRAY